MTEPTTERHKMITKRMQSIFKVTKTSYELTTNRQNNNKGCTKWLKRYIKLLWRHTEWQKKRIKWRQRDTRWLQKDEAATKTQNNYKETQSNCRWTQNDYKVKPNDVWHKLCTKIYKSTTKRCCVLQCG